MRTGAQTTESGRQTGAPSSVFCPLSSDRREAVIEEARSWIGTPYHHMGRVKGVAVDCLTFLAEVYERAGVIPHVEVPFYPPDWFMHRDEERYVEGVLRYAREIAGGGREAKEYAGDVPALPGDIAIFRFGRCFAHGGIITDWPLLIHAFQYTGVVPFSAQGGLLRGRKVRFFTPFA